MDQHKLYLYLYLYLFQCIFLLQIHPPVALSVNLNRKVLCYKYMIYYLLLCCNTKRMRTWIINYTCTYTYTYFNFNFLLYCNTKRMRTWIINYTCTYTYTYFNVFFSYKFIHLLLYQLTSKGKSFAINI